LIRNIIFFLQFCGKGGSGKSTVAILLASAMHKRGKNIFLVDADESNIGLYRMLGTWNMANRTWRTWGRATATY